MPDPMIQQLTQFGVAGLMGVLWVWERLHSRKRERQLSEAHGELMSDREQLHDGAGAVALDGLRGDARHRRPVGLGPTGETEADEAEEEEAAGHGRKAQAEGLRPEGLRRAGGRRSASRAR